VRLIDTREGLSWRVSGEVIFENQKALTTVDLVLVSRFIAIYKLFLPLI